MGFKLILKIDGLEHWVEIDKKVWTRNDLLAWEALSLDDDKLRAWYAQHATAMSLRNEKGAIATEAAHLTDEFLGECDAPVMGFLRNLAFRAYTERSRLGEVTSGQS